MHSHTFPLNLSPAPPRSYLAPSLWVHKLPSAHCLVTGFVQFSLFWAYVWGNVVHVAKPSYFPHPSNSPMVLPLQIGGNLVPMSHCCLYCATAVAPMGEKMKDIFQSNPLKLPPCTDTHTRTWKPKAFPLHPSSHPLPPSDIKGISIETLMRETHLKSNTLQSLHKKCWVMHSLLK